MVGDYARVPVEIGGRTYYVHCEAVPHPCGGTQWDIDWGSLQRPIEDAADEHLVPAEEPTP